MDGGNQFPPVGDLDGALLGAPMLLAAVAASCVSHPALRAAGIDPTVGLRTEPARSWGQHHCSC